MGSGRVLLRTSRPAATHHHPPHPDPPTLHPAAQDGDSPSVPHFIRALHGLCGPATRCYVSSEHRSSDVRSGFVELAQRTFSQVWAGAGASGCVWQGAGARQLQALRVVLRQGAGGACGLHGPGC
jgi:hypothetical protein